MNIEKILVIFRKELLDLFRDKRTVITSIVIPIIIYPLMMIGFSSMMTRQTLILHEQDVIIYIIDNADNENSHFIYSSLENKDNIRIYQETENYRQLFEAKIINAIFTINNVESEGGYPYLDLLITYNSVDERSELAYSNIVKAMYDIENELVISRLHANNISENILKAIDLKGEDIASSSQTFGLIISKILPYFLILISISGAAVAAVDLVAGEKERKTLETILVSAAQRIDLVMGKFLAVITIALITLILNLASIFFSFHFMLTQAAAQVVSVQIPVVNLLLIMVLMLPMIILFSSVLLSLSTFSRNMKEGYSYIQPIMIVAMIFSLVSALPAIELSFGLALIPIVNVSLTIRDVLIGNFNISLFLTTVISTIILVILSIYLSIKLFSNETVLFRTSEEGSLFKSKKGGNWALTPNFAVLFFLLILMLFYYIGIGWQIKDVETGLMKTLIFLVLIPPIILIKVGKLNIKEVLRLNNTNPLNAIIVICASVPLFILVTLLSQLINYFFPIPPEHLDALQKLITFDGKTIWFTLFLIALLPGICEEVMFRGYFLKAFEKKGVLYAIVVSGVLFGILHLDIYRLLPVTILGIWMGYITIKSNSILIPIIAHTANNAWAVLLVRYGELIPGINIVIVNENLAWWMALPSLIIFLLLLGALKKLNETENEKTVIGEYNM